MELIVSGTYLSVEQLLEEVWRKQRQVEVDVTSVRQAVSKLRRSLKIVAPQVDVIKTIPKRAIYSTLTSSSSVKGVIEKNEHQ
ncbi:winged helix-turn-helix domain-containing protein [Vibrio sp. 10N.286.45.E10]|uniref:winged helix-turn-helix domain-containing protein n=1 Tax=Vibrio sp. 10N.286.45.E10 TaxID=1884476 RepID=UPI0039A60D4D